MSVMGALNERQQYSKQHDPSSTRQCALVTPVQSHAVQALADAQFCRHIGSPHDEVAFPRTQT
jgi:hypothetical protein